MRYKILFVIFFTSSFLLKGQIISNYGIKVGVLTSKAVDVSTAVNYYSKIYKGSRVSGFFSLFAQCFNSDYYRFEAELAYKQEGAEDKLTVTTVENPDGTGQSVVDDHLYDFLSFSISLQPKIEIEDIGLYAIISPTLKYLLKNRDHILDKDVRTILLGYNLGFGIYPKNILNGKLFLEMQFSSSFSKVIESKYFEARFNTVQFSIGSYIN